jgi:hypothetical protein
MKNGSRTRSHAPAVLALLLLFCITNSFETAAQSNLYAATSDASAVERPRAPALPLKRLVPLRVADTPEGSRVRIASDASLADYKAFRQGARFYVHIARAAADFAQDMSGLAGRGFTDARLERKGDDVLVSFALSDGATARVSQSFNRLDVLFSLTPQTPAPVVQQQPPPTTGQTNTGQTAGSDAGTTTTTATPPATTTTNPSVATDPAAAGNTATNSVNKPAVAAGGKIVLPPEKANPIRPARFDRPPVIDGKLDDEVWKTATLLKDFYQVQPGENLPPSKPTEVLLGYDSKFLYVAYRAFDERDKVRATIAKRDSIFNDDYVGLFFDTFNDQRKAYELNFNPLGIQADGVMTEGGGEDFSVDLVHESKGEVNEQGYTVEVAIPFKSLRYEAGKDKFWGVHFYRRIKRINNELDMWMPISRDVTNWLSQAGRMTGLEGISTERTLELIPTLTISETGKRVRTRTFGFDPSGRATSFSGERFTNKPVDFEPGLTAKWSITPTITLDLALNPDFAQVEADATVVTANQRFPIFFEEKRPFFLEGKDIFSTSNTVVHTRAIVDPDVAIKLTGKRGRNSFGLLAASDNAPGNFSEEEREEIEQNILDGGTDDRLRFLDKNAYIGVLRFKRDVGKESNLGFFATTYNFIERHNHLFGIDGRFRINPKTVTNFELIGTHSRRFFRDADLGANIYRTGNAFAYTYVWDYTGRNFGYIFIANGRTRDYRSDVGFVRRTNTNSAEFAFRLSTTPNPKKTLTEFRFQNFTQAIYDWQGRLQGWINGSNFNFNLKRQTFIQIGENIGYDRVFEEEFGPKRTAERAGAFAGADPERSTNYKSLFVFAETTPSKKYSFFGFLGMRRGIFDFDFGAGPRFPRVSPAAIEARRAAEAGLCGGEEDERPAVCSAALDPGSANGFDVEGGVTVQPTDAWRTSLSYQKAHLTREDTGLVAFDENIYVLRSTYQFTRFLFARGRVDYATLASNVRGQFLLGWTPNPGTSFYAGYNDDLNRNGFNPFTGNLEPGFRRNGRVFFIKMSYLIRRSF